MNKRKISVFYFLLVLIFIIFTLGPIIWAGVISITPESEMLKATTNILPKKPTLNNYKEMLDFNSSSNKVVFSGIKNSLKSALMTIIIGIPVATASAYAFSKYEFKGKNILLTAILMTIVIPVFTTIIPIYAMFSKYKLLDSKFWLSVIYISACLPINTWTMKNYFDSIPHEIIEAAKVDGATEREIFFKVVLPISYPIIITCTLMMFLMAWNQYQIPLILTSSQKTKVVTLVLSEFVGRDSIHYGLIAVSGIISILPPAILTIFFRKFLVSGLTSGSVKG